MRTWKILLLAGMICLVGFGVFPLNKEIEEMAIKNKILSEKKDKKAGELKELMGEKNSGQGVVDPEIEIPAKLLQTEIIMDLNRIAKKTNTILPKRWDFSLRHDSDLDVSVLEMSFPIKNHKGNIYKFLQLIEQNERFFGTEGLKIQTVYEGNTKLSEMTVNLYALSQEKFNE